MEFINYLELMESVKARAIEEKRPIEAEDIMFLSYLKDLAEFDKNINDKEFTIIEDTFDLFNDEYNKMIKDEPMYFTIEVI